MQVFNFSNIQKIYNAVEIVVNAYQHSPAYQREGDGATCFFGDTADARGDDAIREAFFSFLQMIVRKNPLDDDVEVFTTAAGELAGALLNATGNAIEVVYTRDGFVVDPDVDKLDGFALKITKRPRLYIGGGEIVVGNI